MKDKIFRGILISILVFFCGLCCSPQEVCAAGTTFTFFYNNSCASCKEDEDIYEMFNRCFTAEEKAQMDYEVLVYNVFLESGEEVFAQYCEKYDQEIVGQEFPVMAVNDVWLSGYEEIEQYLKGGFKKNFEKGNKDTGADGQENEVTAGTRRETSSLLGDFFDEIKPEAGKPFLLFFTTYNCEDCEKVKEFLKENAAGMTIKECNIGEDDMVEVIRNLYAIYQVEESRQQVPAIFSGEQVFIGQEEICSTLLDEKKAKLGDFEKLRSYAEESDDRGTIGSLDYMTLFFSGLLAGFNLCGISMLLMLLSILITSRSSVLKNGLLYVAAKMVTYLGIGVGAYVAVSAAFSAGLERLSRIFTIIMAILLLVLSVMNFIDYKNAKNQQYGKIRMQLPVRLRKFNHGMIKRLSGASERTVPFLALGLGVVISLGEFFCTGQIYMASILYMLRTQAGLMVKILSMFGVYVGAMMLPTIAVLLIIQKTRSAERVSEFMLRRMDMIKLFNAVLFFGFFIYMVVGIL